MTILVLLVVCFLRTGHAHGQSNQAWVEYMLNYPFANSFNLELATTYSTAMNTPKWRSFDVQLTPEYSVTPHVDVMGALFSGVTFQTQSLNTLEVREMLGARFHFSPNKRILTRLLLRFEQRNLQNVETSEWDHSTRTRVRLEALIPINRPTLFAGDKLWYAIADAEGFIVMDQDVQERFANRLRFRAGVGYRLTYGTRFELMYTLQQSRNAIEDGSITSDHIIRFRLKQYLNKSKPSPAQGTGN